MQIHVSAEAKIARGASFATRISGVVETALGHCKDRITRVDVHISDENGLTKGHEDKRCVMEAHIEGLAPKAVTHHATTYDRAVHGAADKLKRSVESTIDKLRRHA